MITRVVQLMGQSQAEMMVFGRIVFGGGGLGIQEAIPNIPLDAEVICSYVLPNGGAFDGAKAGIVHIEMLAVGLIGFASTNAADNNTVAYVATW